MYLLRLLHIGTVITVIVWCAIQFSFHYVHDDHLSISVNNLSQLKTKSTNVLQQGAQNKILSNKHLEWQYLIDDDREL